MFGLLIMSKFDEKRWVDQVKRDLTLEKDSCQMSPCIFSVSTTLLKEYEDAYVPQIVSIGPYHFGNDKLGGMETFKGEAARREVVRIGDTPDIFNLVVEKITNMEGEIRCCYDKEIPYNSEVLGWMMARDACFILEFFRNYVFPSSLPKLHPIFGPESEHTGVKSEIMKDLIKLENQIPLFVLEQVLAMEMGDSLENGKSKLQILLKAVFQKIYYRPFDYLADGESPRQSHILDIYYYYCLGEEDGYVHRNRFSDVKNSNKRKRSKIPSAVELKNGGVKIQANGEKVEDVRFEGRTLSIPRIKFDVDSETFIRNLIALEICSPYCPLKRMTDYVQFMDELCETEKAVRLMREEMIIMGNLRHPSRIIQLSNFSNLVAFQPTCVSIDEARNNVNKTYDRDRSIACTIVWNEFRKTYGSKPWLVIGGIGATIILLLTAVQVFCLFKNCGAQ